MSNHRTITAFHFRMGLSRGTISLLLATALAATISFIPASQAQTSTVLHNFDSGADGGTPYAGVTLDQQGRIYGTASAGGTGNGGVVYRLDRHGDAWVETPIYTFQGTPDGATPYSRVIFGPNGALYGTTSYGGTHNAGTVFSLRPQASACHAALCPWSETIFYSFTNGADGAYPTFGDLAFDPAGNLYGTTVEGGAHNYGVVFKLTPSSGGWTESVIWSFTNGNDGANPYAGVVFDGAGNLYGTTLYGAQGFGTVYELYPTQSGWTEKTLYAFNQNDNGSGAGGLVMDSHGNLFGITGDTEDGAAYELTPIGQNWGFILLQTFSGSYPGPLAAPTFDAQGNLYGPLPTGGQGDGGEIFRMTPSGGGWIYSDYYDFINGGGYAPIGAVVFDASGNMYGTSAQGGSHSGGTVWEVTP